MNTSHRVLVIAAQVFPPEGKERHFLSLASADALHLNVWYRGRYWRFVCALAVFENQDLDIPALILGARERLDQKLSESESAANPS